MALTLKQTKYRKIPRGEKSSSVNSTSINTVGTTLSLTGSPSPFGFHSVTFVKKESLLIKVLKVGRSSQLSHSMRQHRAV